MKTKGNKRLTNILKYLKVYLALIRYKDNDVIAKTNKEIENEHI